MPTRISPVSADRIIRTTKWSSASIKDDEAILPVVEKLQREFPRHHIRVLFGSGRVATNDKVAKLARLVSEARHEVLVISDSDVRVASRLSARRGRSAADPKVGAATCFYVPTGVETFAENLQSIGMMSDFYAGILVAWQLDGVKFTLGPSIVTTRAGSPRFGGYAAIENRPADDLLVGRLIAEQGYEVALLRYCVSTVADFGSIGDLLHKRMRWIVVMRHMRPWGHLGLLLTQGLPWSLLAVAVHPTAGGRRRISGNLLRAARRHDRPDRRLGIETARHLVENAPDSGLGCAGVLSLADQFHS